jgi:hypothetical protein
MSARVLLMRLSCRTSAKGVEYLSGFLGCARVVAFKAKETDKFGNAQWAIYFAEPEPKNAQQRSQPTTSAVPQDDPSAWSKQRRDAYQNELAARFQPDEEIPF